MILCISETPAEDACAVILCFQRFHLRHPSMIAVYGDTKAKELGAYRLAIFNISRSFGMHKTTMADLMMF